MTEQTKKLSLGRLIQPNSLRFQLLFRSLAILTVLLILIGVFQYLLVKHFMYQNRASSLHSQISSIPRDLFPVTNLPGGIQGGSSQGNGASGNNPQGIGTGPGGRKELFERSPLAQQDTTLAFIDENGGFTVLSEAPGVEAPRLDVNDYLDQLKQQKNNKTDWKVVHDSNPEQLVALQPFIERGRLRGLIQVSASTKPIKDVLLSQTLTFIGLSLLALVIGLLTFIPIMKRTLVPLNRMVRTVTQIDSGNLAERFPVEQGQVEIDRLSHSFNGMLERLEASFQAELEANDKMRRFVADASHELRTPLTSIHGFLEVLLRGAAAQPEQLDRALRSMYGESGRINKLVQDLLMLAKLDRSPTIQAAEGHLDDVFQEMEPQLLLLAGNRKVSFDMAADAPCLFEADKIKQVILNLFQNAVQYTNPDSGSIHISVRRSGHGTEFSIKDNGPGIPEDKIPHIFDRFYRVDSSRARKYGGAGLGLSITKSIVDLHRGLIHVNSAPDEGSEFLVWLPST
jgi:two-component system OmpR family sensor kinase